MVTGDLFKMVINIHIVTLAIMQIILVKRVYQRPDRYARYESESLTHLFIPGVQAWSPSSSPHPVDSP